jgi:CubicO group peptidase (beta-lactamase class C family)
MQFVRAIYPVAGAARGFLSPATLEAAWTPVREPPDCSRTLGGWDTPSGPEPSAGPRFSRRSVGHLGYTGTSLWIDRDAGIAVALLSNRVHPTRENNLIRAFRPRFYSSIR